MTKKIFMEQLTGELLTYFPPESYEIRSDVFIKNNDTKRYGIVIRAIGGAIAPTIYIDHYYEDYRSKKSTIDEVAQQICSFVRGMDDYEEKYRSFSAEWEDCREKIVYRLISMEKNSTFLSSIPHLPFLNLAIIFSIVYELSDRGLESICITNELQNRWEISTRELYEVAAENTPKLMPASIDTMAHVLEIFWTQLKHEYGADDDRLPKIYILSNSYGINGASAILYEGLIQNMAERENHNFYILPSSIHELLLIPDDGDRYSREDLSRMVQEINHGHVREDEILSDRAYYYDRNEKKFIV